jgi:hypothetical protein
VFLITHPSIETEVRRLLRKVCERSVHAAWRLPRCDSLAADLQRDRYMQRRRA